MYLTIIMLHGKEEIKMGLNIGTCSVCGMENCARGIDDRCQVCANPNAPKDE